MTTHRSQRRFTLNRRTFTAGGAALMATAPWLRVSAQEAATEPELEIFSWWTTGGEEAGLQQLFDAFAEQYPDVDIVNAAVAGGAGSNAQVALQTRLSGGQPPDSWQSHPGEELFNLYVDPGYVQPVTSIWESQGWYDVYPEGLVDQVTRDGEQYLVPVGVHRGNVMFYNKQVLADNGFEIGEEVSVDQLLEMAEALDMAGIPTIGLGSQDTFAAPQLFENVLVARLGPEDYTGLWNGETSWDSQAVTEAIETFGQLVDYANEDHPALTWDGAVDAVIDGRAAFTSMGDWAWGHVVSRESEEQIGWVAHPGSSGSFVAVVDGFTLPETPPHPTNAENWLVTVGSAEAQVEFAPFKGAIPARTDIDASEFSEYLRWSAADFAEAAVVPSMAHGAAASPQFRQSIFDATVNFLVSQDVAAFQEELVFAAEDANLGE